MVKLREGPFSRIQRIEVVESPTPCRIQTHNLCVMRRLLYRCATTTGLTRWRLTWCSERPWRWTSSCGRSSSGGSLVRTRGWSALLGGRWTNKNPYPVSATWCKTSWSWRSRNCSSGSSPDFRIPAPRSSGWCRSRTTSRRCKARRRIGHWEIWNSEIFKSLRF